MRRRVHRQTGSRPEKPLVKSSPAGKRISPGLVTRFAFHSNLFHSLPAARNSDHKKEKSPLHERGGSGCFASLHLRGCSGDIQGRVSRNRKRTRTRASRNVLAGGQSEFRGKNWGTKQLACVVNQDAGQGVGNESVKSRESVNLGIEGGTEQHVGEGQEHRRFTSQGSILPGFPTARCSSWIATPYAFAPEIWSSLAGPVLSRSSVPESSCHEVPFVVRVFYVQSSRRYA